ncbi:MAG: hypothetical protein VX032_05395, partial [SAR324 cluster bacterium]|nr:hypothetical protein [SAR324 cluster bacterium]
GYGLARTRRYDHENNVVLEELSLVVAAEKPLFLRESVRNSLVFGAVVWTTVQHNYSTRLSNRLL